MTFNFDAPLTNTLWRKNHKSEIINQKTMNKEIWQKILHFAITILTAIATTLGTTSCLKL